MSTANIDPTFALAFLQAAKKGLDAKIARDETSPGVYRNIVMDVETGVADMEKRLREEVIAKLPRTPAKGAVTVDPDNVRVTLKSMRMAG